MRVALGVGVADSAEGEHGELAAPHVDVDDLWGGVFEGGAGEAEELGHFDDVAVVVLIEV